jgi:hypothetical protein
LPNCWKLFFLVLPKLDGCQADLPNYWSCSTVSIISYLVSNGWRGGMNRPTCFSSVVYYTTGPTPHLHPYAKYPNCVSCTSSTSPATRPQQSPLLHPFPPLLPMQGALMVPPLSWVFLDRVTRQTNDEDVVL